MALEGIFSQGFELCPDWPRIAAITACVVVLEILAMIVAREAADSSSDGAPPRRSGARLVAFAVATGILASAVSTVAFSACALLVVHGSIPLAAPADRELAAIALFAACALASYLVAFAASRREFCRAERGKHAAPPRG